MCDIPPCRYIINLLSVNCRCILIKILKLYSTALTSHPSAFKRTAECGGCANLLQQLLLGCSATLVCIKRLIESVFLGKHSLFSSKLGKRCTQAYRNSNFIIKKRVVGNWVTKTVCIQKIFSLNIFSNSALEENTWEKQTWQNY